MNIEPTPKSRAGKTEAALAVWNWRVSTSSPSRSAQAGRNRKEGAIRALVGGVAASVVWFVFHHQIMATVIGSLALMTLLTSLLSPLGIYARIQTAIDALARFIGEVMSWLLLPLFFFGFCLPFGWTQRRGRRDKMERWFETGAPTYWKERDDEPRNRAYYERQF